METSLPPSRKLMRHQTRLLPNLVVITAQIGKIRFGSAHQLSTSPQVGGSPYPGSAIFPAREFCASRYLKFVDSNQTHPLYSEA
jgi:hypothetical protein